MLVKLGKKSNPDNLVLFVDKTTVLDSKLNLFVQTQMKLTKNENFKVSLLQIQSGKKIKKYIIIKFKTLKSFPNNIEDVVAKLGEIIITLNHDFYLDLSNYDFSKQVKLLFENLLIGKLYSFTSYKKDNNVKYCLTISDHERSQEEFNHYYSAYFDSRDLIVKPSNLLDPDSFEQIIYKDFSNYKNVKLFTIKGEDLNKNGFGGIYNVGKGSQIPPRIVILEYIAKKGSYDFGLVGKGLTFDTGGYNLKGTGDLEGMSIDMSGAGILYGVAKYLITTNYKKNFVVAFGIAENLISGNSYKPGDVITMYNGKTVKILNTDAEGRLVIADCLSFLQEKYKPKYLIDIATLTSSQIFALGNKFAALLGNNKNFNKKIIQISNKIKERVWELPLYIPYKKKLDSDIADLSNLMSGGKLNPGCIGGGLFLLNFVNNSIWAHLDIAGPVGGFYFGKDDLTGSLANPYGFRLLIELMNEL